MRTGLEGAEQVGFVLLCNAYGRVAGVGVGVGGGVGGGVRVGLRVGSHLGHPL